MDTKAAEEVLEKPVLKKENKGSIPAGISYGKNGFEFRTDNDKFSLAIQNRVQARYAEPFDTDPRTLADLERDENSFMIRRARTKLTGHAYAPWLKYYLQYDWSQPALRDLNLTIDKYKWAQVRVGRGKVSYNNERVTSSGSQQFVNRSIVNDIFTVDRQQDIEVAGRYAFVDMDTHRDNDKQTEFSAVINYFLKGRYNKLSLEYAVCL